MPSVEIVLSYPYPFSTVYVTQVLLTSGFGLRSGAMGGTSEKPENGGQGVPSSTCDREVTTASLIASP